MKKIVAMVATAAALIAAAPASAAAFLFQITGNGQNISFELDDTPTVSNSNGNRFQINNVTLWGTVAGDYRLRFNINGGLGILTGTSGNNFVLDLLRDANPVLFTGSTSAPTLVAGNYTLYGPGNINNGSALAYSVAVTAVPEPATWAMMIGGFGLAGMSLRRKRGTSLAAA